MAQNSSDKVLRHVVLFKFKDGTTPEQAKLVEDAFRKLPTQIKEIKGFEWGTNNSPEGLAQGFTHCFFLTFHSEADRAVYLPHPDHKAFGKVLGPYLDKVLVVDYWTQK
ncbi:MAG: Dabb family protein [Spirosomataceae bacterium]